MAVTTTKTNKPIIPRGQDASPLKYNRAALYSGKALDFDGVNDYIDLAGFTLSGSVASFSFYVNADGTGNVYFLDANPNRFVLRFSNNNVALFSGSLVEFGAINTNEWTHLVYVLNGTSAKCYANGVQLGTEQTITAIDLSAATDFDLGRWYLGGAFYDGGMANFKTFNTALTAAQVSDLYNNPEKIVPTGVEDTALKLWLPMMEGAGTTAYDGSGNGNHGTISGATYVQGVGAPVAQSAVIDWNKLYDFDGVDDQAYNTSYNDTTGTKTYKVHFNSHDVTQQDQQIIQSFVGASEQNGFGATIAPFGGNSNIAGLRVIFGGVSGAQLSWPVENNTFYELVFTIDWDAQVVSNATLNGEAATGTLGARVANPSGGLYLGSRVNTMYLKGIVNYFEVVGEEKWTNASGFKSESGSYDMTISGSPAQILAPQGLTSGRDITGVNLFENVRKQGALNLDGNSWAEVHDNASFDFGTAVSLEAWVYWQGDNNDDGIIGRYGSTTAERDCTLYAYSGGVQFYVTANAVSYTSMTNGWRHIVGTYDGANKRLYVDGVQVNSSAETSTMPGGSIPMEIGRYNQSASTTFTQPIAQPRIYNRALTAEEVERNYNAGKNIYK